MKTSTLKDFYLLLFSFFANSEPSTLTYLFLDDIPKFNKPLLVYPLKLELKNTVEARKSTLYLYFLEMVDN